MDEIVVVFHSYTGSLSRYYIYPVSGNTYVTELVIEIINEEQRTDESLNVWDFYLSWIKVPLRFANGVVSGEC